MTTTVEDAVAKRCTQCKTTKPLDQYYAAKNSTDGHKSWCKICCDRHGNLVRQRNRENAEAAAARLGVAVATGPVAAPEPDWPAPARDRYVDWRHQAACRGEDGELWFPIGTSDEAVAQTEEAKAFCRRCPAMQECLEFALTTNQEAGVWGAISEGERRSLKKRASRNRGSGRAA